MNCPFFKGQTMSLLSERIIALILLFITTFGVGVLPVTLIKYWKQRQESKKVHITGTKKESTISSKDSRHILLQMMMQFGGGVLLCTIFVHLLPEVREDYNSYQLNNGTFFGQSLMKHGDHVHDHDENGGNHSHEDAADEHSHKHEIPYIELIICIGFFTVYFFECIMNAIISVHEQKHDDQDDRKSCKNLKEFEEQNNTIDLDEPKSPSAYINYGAIIEDNDTQILPPTKSNSKHRCNSLETDSFNQKYISPNENCSHVEPVFVSFMKGLVIIIAFSVHSIFDGLAIGLQSTASGIWTMLFAISTHKLVIAFVVSIELYEQSKRISIVIINMALFSIMSPIGILIVIIAEGSIKNSSQSSPAIIILNALAIGTILYIVFFEILQKTNINLTGLIQFSSMVFGFAIMFVITIFIN